MLLEEVIVDFFTFQVFVPEILRNEFGLVLIFKFAVDTVIWVVSLLLNFIQWLATIRAVLGATNIGRVTHFLLHEDVLIAHC